MNKKALSVAFLAIGLLVSFGLVHVHAATPVSAGFSFPTYNSAYGPVAVGTGSPTAFNSTASGGSPPYTFNWNFSDGTTASGAYLSHVFSAAGTYNVTLTVSDSATGATTVSHLVSVVASYPVDFSHPAISTGSPVTFNATQGLYLYYWDFGDGGTYGSQGSFTTHTYTNSGTYFVVLTTRSVDGIIATVSHVVVVASTSVTADFSFPTYNAAYGGVTASSGNPVAFNATASGGTSPSTFAWNFGDGLAGSGSPTSHIFSAPGGYTVVLTVTDLQGVHATSSHFVIVVSTYQDDFSHTTATMGSPALFNATQGLYVYYWDFGDGGTYGSQSSPATHTYARLGTYFVVLTTVTSAGVLATVSHVVVVASTPVVADFSPVTSNAAYGGVSVGTGSPMVYSATASGGASPYTFSWNFGDGSSGTGSLTTYTYSAAGVYTVTLTVTDSNGNIAVASHLLTVVASYPIDFSHSAISSGSPALFNATQDLYVYYWDFGDGGTYSNSGSNGNFATHTYTNSGTYFVVLTTVTSAGVIATVSHVVAVASTPVTADFSFPTYNAAYGGVSVGTGSPMIFNATTSGGTQPYTFAWNFGDGSSTTGNPAEHIYDATGTFTVTLTVTDSNGHVTEASHFLGVVASYSVDFSHPAISTGSPVTFNATQDLYVYYWDFGDGGTYSNSGSNGNFATHTYTNSGTYFVVLTTVTSAGVIATVSHVVVVASTSVTADFSFPTQNAAYGSATPSTGSPVAFNATASGGTSPYTFAWNFGDGSTRTGTPVSHTFSLGGFYTATLTVTDSNGNIAVASHLLTVVASYPVDFSHPAISTGSPVTFNATQRLYLYYWDFGDGGTYYNYGSSNGAFATHVYSRSGTYFVVLTTRTVDGTIATISHPAIVVASTFVVDFTFQTAPAGSIETFSGTSGFYFYNWDFGDGSTFQNYGSNGASNATHTYSRAGFFITVMTVEDGIGNSATASHIFIPTLIPPTAGFTESATTVHTGVPISFDASASTDPDGTITDYQWSFGDGGVASGVTVSHTYTRAGQFGVYLTVTDNTGLTNTASATKTITDDPPVASFTESTTTGRTGTPIGFDASASFDPDGTITDYAWYFTDYGSIHGKTVSHTYTYPGTFSVYLYVTDDAGLTSSQIAATKTITSSVVASFTESATTVHTGVSISFDASSSTADHPITDYNWYFGDGSSSVSGVTASHTYTKAGSFQVSLSVTDNTGLTNTAYTTKTITDDPPVASFTESTTTGRTGTPISFDASASFDPDGTITDYTWSLYYYGLIGHGQTFSYTFTTPGTFTVYLYVTDDAGLQTYSTATKTITSSIAARFTESATTVHTGVSISFDASGSTADGTITDYSWSFGDGGVASGVTVSHTYTRAGQFGVYLTVTDNAGLRDTASATKAIIDDPPVASFTESATTSTTGTAISFDASASFDPDGTITDYTWSVPYYYGTIGHGQTFSYTFTTPGTFTVYLYVTDDAGLTTYATATKTITSSVVASFTESATTVHTGITISFDASGSTAGGTITDYSWNFGDGSPGTSGITVSHTYIKAGQFTVYLTVTDNTGLTNTVYATKTITDDPPVASFTESTTTGRTGTPISFDASASFDPDGTITDYTWSVPYYYGTIGHGQTFSYTFTTPGTYDVYLYVTDDAGLTSIAATATKTIVSSVVASFTESATTVHTGITISFDGSTSRADHPITQYSWSFGDGGGASGVTASHTFTGTGVFTVYLSVSDNAGLSDRTSTTKTVTNEPPVARFSESTTTAQAGIPISFDASASSDIGGTITVYLWDFGDGTGPFTFPSQVHTTAHSYAAEGGYMVTLTVTDDAGLSGQATAAKTIIGHAPVASFTESVTTTPTGTIITFDAAASSDLEGPIASYSWTFGDGGTASTIIPSHSYAKAGSYTVTLTVRDGSGDTNTITSTKSITNRSPIALFTESATIAPPGTIIHFDASSSSDPDGSITIYTWDFGDSITGTGPSTIHSYTTVGTYTVRLTVTDDNQASSFLESTKTILDLQLRACFTESKTHALSLDGINFDASCTQSPAGPITSYAWAFGDGATATGVSTSHSYAKAGSYTVTLRVTDNQATTDTITAVKTVTNRNPTSCFTEDLTSMLTGVQVSFDASCSSDLDGTVENFSWTFGDGAAQNGKTVTHTYSRAGSYTVTLTVTDDNGGVASSTSTKTVENRNPTACFTENTTAAPTHTSISFDGSCSTDPDGTITYAWDFGDTTTATGQTTSHAYGTAGSYTVRLTVTDDNGASSSTTSSKTIRGAAPTASFTESATSGLPGTTIHFDASASTDSDGTITKYEWAFGDGATGTGVTVDHTYPDTGTFTVILTVTDDTNLTGSATAVKTIASNQAPTISFTEDKTTASSGETITLTITARDSDGTVTSITVGWGDGNRDPLAGTATEAGHSYNKAGEYEITVEATDNDGSTASSTAMKTITNRNPTASFTESATTAPTGTSINFDASGSTDPDGTVASYAWNFGDGNTVGTGVTVLHSYDKAGTYTVGLTVTDDTGATGTATAVKTIVNRLPTAQFTESATAAPTGTTITYNGATSSDPDGTIRSYEWDFGDRSQATGPTAGHVYPKAGTYTASLTVTDDDGGIAMSSSTKTISDRAPTASFTESTTSSLTGFSIHFDASTSSDPDGTISSYSWDFGDGTPAASGVTVSYSYSSPSPTGGYTVTLRVIDDSGSANAATSVKTITSPANVPPLASFTESATTAQTGVSISFDASASNDPDGGSIVSYAWDFGDGTTGTGANTAHTFTTASPLGGYTVTLTVKDGDGGATGTSTSVKSITTIAARILLSFQAFDADDFERGIGQLDVRVNGNLVVNVPGGLFHLRGTGDYTPFENSWASLGPFDITGFVAYGTNTIVFSDPLSSHDSLVRNINIVSGSLTFLAFKGTRHVSPRNTVTLTFSNPPLQLSSFTVSPTPVVREQRVTFTAAYTGGVGPFKCSFDFGDDSSGSVLSSAQSCSVTHAYDEDGSFTVTVRIKGVNMSDLVTGKLPVYVLE